MLFREGCCLRTGRVLLQLRSYDRGTRTRCGSISAKVTLVTSVEAVRCDMKQESSQDPPYVRFGVWVPTVPATVIPCPPAVCLMANGFRQACSSGVVSDANPIPTIPWANSQSQYRKHSRSRSPDPTGNAVLAQASNCDTADGAETALPHGKESRHLSHRLDKVVIPGIRQDMWRRFDEIPSFDG